MKLSLTLLCGFLSAVLISCDSSTPLQSTVDENATATVLSEPANGDKLIFSHTDAKDEPFISELTLTGRTTQAPFVSYVYQPVTQHRFDLTLNANRTTLDQPLEQLLGAPVTLSARFRELIFREEAVFTAAELEELVALMNPSGATLIIDPDDPLKLLATGQRVYHFNVTSNVADQIFGSMGGSYYAEENSYQVRFREPTSIELDRFRFLTTKHKLPFITGIANGIQVSERGRFVLDLVNVNNAPDPN